MHADGALGLSCGLDVVGRQRGQGPSKRVARDEDLRTRALSDKGHRMEAAPLAGPQPCKAAVSGRFWARALAWADKQHLPKLHTTLLKPGGRRLSADRSAVTSSSGCAGGVLHSCKEPHLHSRHLGQLLCGLQQAVRVPQPRPQHGYTLHFSRDLSAS